MPADSVQVDKEAISLEWFLRFGTYVSKLRRGFPDGQLLELEPDNNPVLCFCVFSMETYSQPPPQSARLGAAGLQRTFAQVNASKF